MSRAATRTLTTIAAMALALAACDVTVETDEPADEPQEEPTEQPDEAPEIDDTDDGAEPAALPTGMFGPECDRLMESVEATDDRTTQDPLNDDAATDDDDPLTDTDAATDDDPLTDDDATTAPHEDDASARLASMSLIEALEAIPDLQPLGEPVQRAPAAEMIEDDGLVTVFAPLDVDMAMEPATDGQNERGTIDNGLDNGTDNGLDGATDRVGDLDQLVEAHVHAGQAMDAAQLVESSPIETLDRTVELTVTVDGTDNGLDDGTDNGLGDDDAATDDGDDLTDTDAPTLRVDGPNGDDAAIVVCANIETADGFIHVIDQPIISTGFEDGDGLGTDESDDPFDDDENGLFDQDDDDDDLTG